MSGIKISRTENENRFKKGMYPTENDFANAFASFVHKDDTISMSQVTLAEGEETIDEVIDKKADKQTLEDFISEIETVLETTRDEETGEISKTVIQDLSKRIEDAEKKLADTSNTAERNENAIVKILSILGKQEGETVSELAERFTSLSGDYATVYAFVSKVKDFLESADVADETINRWQEIESFLQGITDTETLTGLLQEMKQEIIEQIPDNYLEQVADLDGYTDAPEGKIVQYIGQTNENYTRGFMYERKVFKETIFLAGRKMISYNNVSIVDDIVLDGNYYEDPSLNLESPFDKTYAKCTKQLQDNGDGTFSEISCSDDIIICRTPQKKPIPGSYVSINGVYHKLPAELELVGCSDSGTLLRNYEYPDYVFVPSANLWINYEDVEFHQASDNYKTFINPDTGDIYQFDSLSSLYEKVYGGLLTTADGTKIFLVNYEDETPVLTLTEDITADRASWQLIPVSPVIS